jgi:hypothetical protein
LQSVRSICICGDRLLRTEAEDRFGLQPVRSQEPVRGGQMQPLQPVRGGQVQPVQGSGCM